MNRIILSFLNGPAFFFAVLIAIGIQTSLFVTYPFNYLQPDFVMLAMIWCALRRSFYEGGILTLLFAYAAELHSGAPQGIYLLLYILVFLAIRASFRFLSISGVRGMVWITLGSTLLWRLLFIVILWLLGLGENQLRYTLALVFPNAVINATLAIFVFKWLDQLDLKTYKSTQSRQLLDDSLQLEGEGL